MKDPFPLVTIITPAYNRASFLDETIQSVLSQDYPNIEYIVLDDGSTDHTRQVLEEYTGRIILESHPNMGETATVNLMVYELGEAPQISSRVRTSLGAELTRPSLAAGRAAAGPAGQTALRTTLDTGLLDAGEYTLIVTATDPATGRQATSSGPFLVAPR